MLSLCQAIQSAQLPLLYVNKEAAGLPLEIVLKAFTVYLAINEALPPIRLAINKSATVTSDQGNSACYFVRGSHGGRAPKTGNKGSSEILITGNQGRKLCYSYFRQSRNLGYFIYGNFISSDTFVTNNHGDSATLLSGNQ